MRADGAFEFRDVCVVDRDRLASRLHPQRRVAGELGLIELTVPRRAEHVNRARQHPLGHHRVHLRFEATAPLHQRGR